MRTGTSKSAEANYYLLVYTLLSMGLSFADLEKMSPRDMLALVEVHAEVKRYEIEQINAATRR